MSNRQTLLSCECFNSPCLVLCRVGALLNDLIKELNCFLVPVVPLGDASKLFLFYKLLDEVAVAWDWAISMLVDHVTTSLRFLLLLLLFCLWRFFDGFASHEQVACRQVALVYPNIRFREYRVKLDCSLRIFHCFFVFPLFNVSISSACVDTFRRQGHLVE